MLYTCKLQGSLGVRAPLDDAAAGLTGCSVADSADEASPASIEKSPRQSAGKGPKAAGLLSLKRARGDADV
jgi:hypothetical protein